MRAFVALALALALSAASAVAAPIRCPDDGEGGGACVWGKAEAYDGASLQVRGLTVLVAGIVVPHRRELCQNKTTKTSFDCARPARKRMGELLAKGVACDILDAASDKLLGRCFVAEGELGQSLVAAGVARAAKDGPYEPDQGQALAAKKGLWAADMLPPRDWETLRRKGE